GVGAIRPIAADHHVIAVGEHKNVAAHLIVGLAAHQAVAAGDQAGGRRGRAGPGGGASEDRAAIGPMGTGDDHLAGVELCDWAGTRSAAHLVAVLTADQAVGAGDLSLGAGGAIAPGDGAKAFTTEAAAAPLAADDHVVAVLKCGHAIEADLVAELIADQT